MGNLVVKPTPPKGRVFERIHTQEIDRGVAHVKMKERGLRHVNKKSHTSYVNVFGMTVTNVVLSYFSSHWRKVLQAEFEEK